MFSWIFASPKSVARWRLPSFGRRKEAIWPGHFIDALRIFILNFYRHAKMYNIYKSSQWNKFLEKFGAKHLRTHRSTSSTAVKLLKTLFVWPGSSHIETGRDWVLPGCAMCIPIPIRMLRILTNIYCRAEIVSVMIVFHLMSTYVKRWGVFRPFLPKVFRQFWHCASEKNKQCPMLSLSIDENYEICAFLRTLCLCSETRRDRGENI